jgi:glycosyltransferase involved in cell wall biosynthesis
MKLSICIPTYNRISFLQKTIKTILLSNRHDFDLVISDNCSTDNTQGFCLNISQQDSRLKYFRNNQNLGISQNVYQCIINANSEYIYFLSDEDEFNSEMIDRAFNLLDSNYSAILSSVYDMHNNNFYIKRDTQFFKNFNYDLIMQMHTYISGIIIKKSSLNLKFLEKSVIDPNNIYPHVPVLIMCFLKGDCYVTSEILCNKGVQEFRSSNNSFISDEFISKSKDLPFYHPINRAKQLVFFAAMTKAITKNTDQRNIIYKYFGYWAVSILYSNYIIKEFGKIDENIIKDISKIEGIGKDFRISLFRYKLISFARIPLKIPFIRIPLVSIKKFISEQFS